MKKSHKKLENQIIKALNAVCETAKHEIDGFKWVSHFVDFNAFPQSLKVVCMFESKHHYQSLDAEKNQGLRLLIQKQLAKENIVFHDVNGQIKFDT